MGLEVDTDGEEFDIKKPGDVDRCINEQIDLKNQMLDNIERSKDLIIRIDENIDLLTQLQHQIKIEKYKLLNPGKDIF